MNFSLQRPLDFESQPGWSSGLLSLGLPGLGQLFQQRYVASVFYFSFFAAALIGVHSAVWTARVGVFFASFAVWFVALAAARDAFRANRRATREAAPKVRNAAYLLTAAVGFLLWSIETTFGFLPYGTPLKVASDVQRIARGETAPSLDPWGVDYRKQDLGDGTFEVRSCGPDRSCGTEDDYKFRFRAK